MIDRPCPTCGHLHPGGIGAGMCPCADCGLLWYSRPELLAPKSVARLKRLRAEQIVEER